MKKSIFFFAAIAALFSCAKENPVTEAPVAETFSIEIKATAPSDGNDAVTANDNTRSTLVDGGVDANGKPKKFVYWSKGDAIKVLLFPNTNEFNPSFDAPSGIFVSKFSQESAKSAGFRCDSWSWGGTVTEQGISKALKPEGIAIYPATATATSSKLYGKLINANTEVSFILPSNQNAVKDNIESNLNFSYANVSLTSIQQTIDNGADTDVTFNNACAMIELTMPSSLDKKVTSVSLKSETNVPLTGKGTVRLTGYNNVIASPFGVDVTEGGGVVLNNANGFEAGAKYYAVVWPGNHTSGLTITFTAEDGTKATKTTPAVELIASMVKPYTFNKGLVFESVTYDYVYSDGTFGNEVKSNIIGVVIYNGNPKEQFNDIELPDTYSNGLALGLTSYDIKWNDTKILSGVNEALREANSYNIMNYSLGGYTARTYWMQTHPNILLYNYNYGSLPGNVSPWYHGTPKEWQYIISNINSINDKLTAVSGAQTIVASKAYWMPIHNGTYNSSTNAAYAVSYNGSSVTYPVKSWYNSTGQALARPIFAF